MSALLLLYLRRPLLPAQRRLRNRIYRFLLYLCFLEVRGRHHHDSRGNAKH
jgi:hypothetical protein